MKICTYFSDIYLYILCIIILIISYIINNYTIHYIYYAYIVSLNRNVHT